MGVPSQRDDINDIKTGQALMKQDISYMKEKIDLALATLNKLSYVPVKEFEDYKKQAEEHENAMLGRIAQLESYNTKNGLGIKFSNEIVANVLKSLGYVAAGILIYAAAKYFASGGRT